MEEITALIISLITETHSSAHFILVLKATDIISDFKTLQTNEDLLKYNKIDGKDLNSFFIGPEGVECKIQAKMFLQVLASIVKKVSQKIYDVLVDKFHTGEGLFKVLEWTHQFTLKDQAIS